MDRIALYVLISLVALSVLVGCTPREARALTVDKEFTLTTYVGDGRIVYKGVSVGIEDQVNPDLSAAAGETIKITLINGDGMPHDLSIPDFNIKTPLVATKGQSVSIELKISEDRVGTFPYFCTQPGHRQAGQEGKLVIR